MIVTNVRYPAVFGDYFKTFGSEVHFNDVTLVSDDYKQFPAHRVILSAGSTVLRKLLLINSNSQNPVLYLKGVRNEELRSVLQFLYLGETRITEDRINEFMRAAQELELKDFQYNQAPGPSAPVVNKPVMNDLIERKPQMMRSKMESKVPIFKDPKLQITPSSQVQTASPMMMTQPVTVKQMPTTEQLLMRNDDDVALEEEFVDDPPADNQMVPYEEPPAKAPRQQIKCIICQENFDNETTLAQHKKKAHKNVLFHCARCRFQTKDEAMFSQHMKADHTSTNSANQTYRCVLCEFQATKPDDLKVHLKTHNKRTVILNSATNSVEFQ